MSVAAGGGSESAVNPKMTAGIGIVGGLIGVYLTPFHPVLGPLLASLGAVCAIIWGADAIARVASYGLGTGVPSIGYMSVAVGVVGVLAGLAGGVMLGNVFLGPILGVILSAIIGAVIAILGKKIVGMKIPVLLTGTMELTAASAISVIGFSAAIAGGIGMAPIVSSVVVTGFIALLFIMNTMAIQHPFNACLGPQENRVRTLKLAASTGFISMAIVGILGGLFTAKGAVIAIIGAIAWFITIRMFLEASKEEAASVAWSGMWPKEEEL